MRLNTKSSGDYRIKWGRKEQIHRKERDGDATKSTQNTTPTSPKLKTLTPRDKPIPINTFSTITAHFRAPQWTPCSPVEHLPEMVSPPYLRPLPPSFPGGPSPYRSVTSTCLTRQFLISFTDGSPVSSLLSSTPCAFTSSRGFTSLPTAWGSICLTS